ncbi:MULTISPECIES: hypothetical protein [Streptacidiphilus]|uniref:Uncharacterized protein n=1 Tax=Streptacidiphilus cavernicola TaxID=3342716 RepID=A0ABV6UZ80_9ACTN|nr:hypothetical protein [Streptacidiphilus jeojiense]
MITDAPSKQQAARRTRAAAQPDPVRCDMCTEPPSSTGPVLPIGPDGKNVDMGHLGEEYGYTNCFRLAQQAVRA